MKFGQTLSKIFGMAATPAEKAEKPARQAHRMMRGWRNGSVNEDTILIQTLDYPEIRWNREEYKGRMVDVQYVTVNYLSASFVNLAKQGGRDAWSVTSWTDSRTIYPDGFFTGSQNSTGSKDYATFEQAMTAMRDWDVQQLADYLQRKDVAITRLSRDELKALVSAPFFAQQADVQQQKGRVHWSQRVRELGLSIPAPGAEDVFGADAAKQAASLKKYVLKPGT